MKWRLLSPLSPIDVMQRQLVDTDLPYHVTSTPCEADNGNGRVYANWVEDLRYETIQESAPDNVKTDMHKRTTGPLSKIASNSPTHSLLETIHTLITEKFDKLSTTTGQMLTKCSRGCREIKEVGRRQNCS
ncbi:hypothetical protein ACJMK2_003159 [Sinanodonta woodiana]|uniref:Uncharacterized protein n=1 Tax=Sinanodonta woodiana TaxID=1069815 RepID=A0ABD3Y0K9_SINWO